MAALWAISHFHSKPDRENHFARTLFSWQKFNSERIPSGQVFVCRECIINLSI